MTVDALTHVVRESSGPPDGLLVLFHGRGADERDLFPLFDFLDPGRRLLGVTPRGPLRLPPGGAHWYVVREVGFPDQETFTSTFDLAGAWLDAFLAEHEIPPERTVLGGFSQGAVMTYTLGLAAGRPVPRALIALSGFVPTVPGFALDLDRPLPRIAVGHGALDPIIPVEFGQRARDLLHEAGASPLYRESPSLGHSIDPAFLRELRPWLEDVLP